MVRRTISARAFIMVLSSRHSFIWHRTPLLHKQIFHKPSFIYYNLLDCKNQGRGTYELSTVVLSNIVLKEPVLWSYWVGIVCVVLAIGPEHRLFKHDVR